jgi:hypothetical protein
LWRAKDAECNDSRVSGSTFNPPFQEKRLREPDKTKALEKFIEDSIAEIPDAKVKGEAADRMRAGLIPDPAEDDTAAIADIWRECEEASAKVSQADFDKNHAAYLRGLICDAKDSRDAIAKGVILNWISDEKDRRAFSAQLARGLLGEDGKPCAATKDLDESDKERLRAAIAAAAAASPTQAGAAAPSAAPAPKSPE